MAIASAMTLSRATISARRADVQTKMKSISGSIRPFILRYIAMPMHCLHVFRFNFCKQKILDSNKKKIESFHKSLDANFWEKGGRVGNSLPASCICFFQRIVKRLAISGGEMLS